MFLLADSSNPGNGKMKARKVHGDKHQKIQAALVKYGYLEFPIAPS